MAWGEGVWELEQDLGSSPDTRDPLPFHPQPSLLVSLGVSSLYSQVSLLNKDKGGSWEGAEPFAISEQPQPKITLERRAENCYLLPALKLEAGCCVCLCVYTHPTTTICCRESHTVRPFSPAGPTQPSTLFHRHSQNSPLFRVETYFLVGLVTAATQTHISLFFLPFSPSLAQLMLRNRLVPYCCWVLTGINHFQ